MSTDDRTTPHHRQRAGRLSIEDDPGSPFPPAGVAATPLSAGSTARIDIRSVDAAHGLIITVDGALTAHDAPALRHQLDAVLDRHPSVVVIDLSGVPSCDPRGVELLEVIRDRTRVEGISLHLVHLGAPAARQWLTAAGLA